MAEAVVVAAEAASEEAFPTTLSAYTAVLEAAVTTLRGLLDIIKIDGERLPGEVPLNIYDRVVHNDNPSAGQVSTVWQRAALAALAAERAEEIVEALNDGGAVPPELLEPLPAEFPDLA